MLWVSFFLRPKSERSASAAMVEVDLCLRFPLRLATCRLSTQCAIWIRSTVLVNTSLRSVSPTLLHITQPSRTKAATNSLSSPSNNRLIMAYRRFFAASWSPMRLNSFSKVSKTLVDYRYIRSASSYVHFLSEGLSNSDQEFVRDYMFGFFGSNISFHF